MEIINETPKIKVNKQDSTSLQNGEGGEVPIFIGATGKETPNTDIFEFKNYNEASSETQGIGLPANNDMLPVIQDFFDETLKLVSDDLGVPHIYVKDLGNTDASTPSSWINAKKDSRKKLDIQVEAYIFKSTDPLDKIVDILVTIAESLKDDTLKGKPRIAYATVQGWTDAQMKTLTQGTDQITKKIRDIDIGLIEWTKFGKHLARICLTPYYDEPGYYQFRSIQEGEFVERTDAEEEDMQLKGIIFGHDEKPGKTAFPKINLAVSSDYANAEDDRSPLCLIHTNRNINQLIRDAMEVVYPQLKRRETETFIEEVQADLDELCSEKIRLGYMKEGTRVTAVEYKDSPAQLKLKVKATPVNITGIIELEVIV